MFKEWSLRDNSFCVRIKIFEEKYKAIMKKFRLFNSINKNYKSK